jgi:hypothetical protein
MDSTQTERKTPTTKTKFAGCRHPFCPVAIRNLPQAELKFWKKNKKKKNESGNGDGEKAENTELVADETAVAKPKVKEPVAEETSAEEWKNSRLVV